jgi:hypothetical protein
VSRLRKEVIKEVASRWTLISDIGKHWCHARFMLVCKCLKMPVPLVPLGIFSPPHFFRLKFL